MGKSYLKRTPKDKISDAMIVLSLVLLSLTILYPFYYIGMNSFNERLTHGPAFTIAQHWTLANYKMIFEDPHLINAFVMSVMRTVTGIAVTVFLCAMCAYALRKRNLAFRNFYLVLFTITMFFNGGLIPIYLNLKNLHLLDTFLVYILPKAFRFFVVIIFMSYFSDLPDDLEESAKLMVQIIL